MDEMKAISIDGSRGEGGGQILRSSLTLSMITGRPLHMINIRAGRKKPGLLRQHLTAVQAARDISGATVEGAQLGSRTLSFRPITISPGRYFFAIGSAGSATLVLQTVLPALLTVPGRSQLVIEGGTHNPAAPPFDFLAKSYVPLINRMGARVTCTLHRYGFFPAGGGRFMADIESSGTLQPLKLMERGQLRSRTIRARVLNLPLSIADREIKVLRERLGWKAEELVAEELPHGRGIGNVITAEMAYDNVTEVITGFGRRGVAAETVADSLADAVEEYMRSDAPVGEHLADQLMLACAIADGGEYLGVKASSHSQSNKEVLRAFLGCELELCPLKTDTVKFSYKGTRFIP